MSTVNYLIEANAGLAFFFGIYFLLLRNETDFRKLRFFLLAGVVCALVSPLIHLDLIAPQPIIVPVATGLTTLLPEMVVGESNSAMTTAEVLMWAYALVSIGIAVPVVVQGLRMYRFVRSSVGSYFGNYYVMESKKEDSSWSFFKLIFIGCADNLSSEEKDLIVKHEMLHGKLLHSVDRLLCTILCMVFWFNPVVWMYRKSMSRIHEFEVDAIVTSETSSSDYGVLLAKSALSSNGFLLTHHFNQSFILKRIDMLNRIKHRISGWKLTVLATTVVVYFLAVACTEEVLEPDFITTEGIPMNISKEFARVKQNNPGRTFELKEVSDRNGFYSLPQDTKGLVGMLSSPETGRAWIITEAIDRNVEVFAIVDETAAPKNGMTDFYEKLSEILVYPEEARKSGVEGKVFVEFVVMEDGHLTDFKVVKGIGGGCDTEAIRALTRMENWEPGMMRGKAVRQKMVLPLTFKLD
jgi:TonB family protein